MKLIEYLPNVLHAETVEKKVLNLLNHPAALVVSPTTQVNAEKKYLAAGRSTQQTYKITISARSLVKCSCKSFIYFNICSHSVTVSEKEEILNNDIAKFKSCRQ